MGKVIDLSEFKNEPHIAGEAKCLVCGHEWVAVSPTGTTWLECPKCKTMKGTYKYSCLKKEKPHWRCNCGNELFYVVFEGTYCPNCGMWQTGF